MIEFSFFMQTPASVYPQPQYMEVSPRLIILQEMNVSFDSYCAHTIAVVKYVLNPYIALYS